MAGLRIVPIALVLALGGAGCGGDDGGQPRATGPQGCAQTLERLEGQAVRWPDPADTADLRAVDGDVSDAEEALGTECGAADVERLETVACGYLTTVTATDGAAVLFLAAQQDRCASAPGPEADPDEPVATIGQNVGRRGRIGPER
jgi:hypothetical protein